MKLTWRIYFPRIFLAILLCSWFIAFSAPAQQKITHQENKLLKAVQKNPQSEGDLYNYANYLFGQMRLSAANGRIDQILQINAQNEKALRLRSHIQAVQSEKSPQKRQTMVYKFYAADIRSDAEALKQNPQVANQSPALNEKREQTLNELDQRYSIRKVLNLQYQASEKEMLACRHPRQLENRGEIPDAERSYKRLLEKYPNSPQIAAQAIQFFIRRDKIDAAHSLGKIAHRKFPNQVEIRILKDRLEELKGAPDEIHRQRMVQALNNDLRIYEKIRAERK